MVTFFFYILYLALLYLRPLEFFAPDSPWGVTGIVGLLALIGSIVGKVMGAPSAGRSLHFFLLFGLTACVALSVAATGWFGGAVLAIASFSPAATLLVLTLLNVTTRRRLHITIATFCISITTLACASLISYHTGFMEDRLVLNQRTLDDEDTTQVNGVDEVQAVLLRVRSLGFLNDPNDFAQALIMMLPFLLCFRRPRARFHNMMVFVLPAAACLYTIYLTRSRGAILGMGAVLVFLGRSQLGVFRTGVLGMLFLVAVVAGNMSGGRNFSTEEESVGSRIDAWSEGLIMLRTNPVLGVGYGNFGDYFGLTAHNSFVLCFAELGLLGYFFWLGLTIASIMEVTPILKQGASGTSTASSGDARLANAILASVVGFFACAWFLSRAYVDTLYLLLGLCICMGYIARTDGIVVTQRKWLVPRTAIAMFGSVAVVYLFVRFSR